MAGQSFEDGIAQKQKLEALGRIAGGIIHDFNNILSVIEGCAHLALRRFREGKPHEQHMEKILHSTRHGAGLTRQFLSFGRQEAADSSVDLPEVLRQQVLLLEPLFGDAVTISMDVPEDSLWISGSSELVMRVLLNLAVNARDAMPQGGSFSVSCARCARDGGDFVRLSVADTGRGIPADLLPKIFEPFFTTKAQRDGTGLGLAVVSGVVGQMGGMVEAHSKVGAGTSFDIYLPLRPPPMSRAGGRLSHKFFESSRQQKENHVRRIIQRALERRDERRG